MSLADTTPSVVTNTQSYELPPALSALGLRTAADPPPFWRTRLILAGKPRTRKTGILASRPDTMVADCEGKMCLASPVKCKYVDLLSVPVDPATQRPMYRPSMLGAKDQHAGWQVPAAWHYYRAIKAMFCTPGSPYYGPEKAGFKNFGVDSLQQWSDRIIIPYISALNECDDIRYSRGFGMDNGWKIAAKAVIDELNDWWDAGFGWTVIAHIEDYESIVDSKVVAGERLAHVRTLIQPLYSISQFMAMVVSKPTTAVVGGKTVDTQELTLQLRQRDASTKMVLGANMKFPSSITLPNDDLWNPIEQAYADAAAAVRGVKP